MSGIRVGIVDDETLVREGIASLLEMQEGITVVGQASTGAEAIQMAAEVQPDVLLMDVRMPGMNGVEATRRICREPGRVRVLVLTTFAEDEYVFAALEAGAAGYLLKNADPEELARAIRRVYEGESVLDPAVTARVVQVTVAALAETAPAALRESLSPRERQVLRLVAAGNSNDQIAEKLYLSRGTVKNHVSRILGKLHARDRAHAARLAVEWGLM